jgi:acetyl esterase/lipase
MPNIILVILLMLAVAAQPLRAQQAAPATASPPPAPTQTSTQRLPTAGPVHQNVAYGVVNGETLLLDVYEPDNIGGKPRPAVILIHGGAWSSFDKSTMHPLAHFLALAGFVAVPVDYRLFHDDANRWPSQLDDVQRAVRWFRANAATYHADPNHVGAYGHSAGGQLALLLGMLETRDNSEPALAKYSSKVQAVVDAAGPTDFTMMQDDEAQKFMGSYLGGSYAAHPELWRDASPIFHAAKTDAPILIIHGKRDQLVAFAQGQKLYDALTEAGATVQLLALDSDHDFSDPGPHRQLALETQKFLDEYLVPAAK